MMFGMPVVPPETGGILGEQNGIITTVYFDFSSKEKSRAIYIPNVKQLNKIICKWACDDINFIGMFHSHLKHADTLSCDDIQYITSVMNNVPKQVEFLLFPIIIPQHKIVFYKVFKSLKIVIENISVIERKQNEYS